MSNPRCPACGDDLWTDVANTIHGLLNHGYRLGCDMKLSWNGRYDTDDEPMPDSNYLPCRKPVAINLDGRNLCNEQSLAEYADRVRLVVDKAKSQQRLSNVEEL